MVKKRTFAEILQEKLGTPPSNFGKKIDIPPPVTDFFHAETPIFGPTFSWKPSGKKYVVRKKPRPQPLIKEDKVPEPTQPSVDIELLNQSERAAWKQIQTMGGLMDLETITEMQLKKAYRTLAKKYHPDTETGFPEAFLKLQEAYSILLKGFYRITATCGNESALA